MAKPLDISIDYAKIAMTVSRFALKNHVIITSLIILGVGVYSLNRISSLSQPEIDQTHLGVELAKLKVVNFDAEAIDRIQQLNSSDIEIESDFTERNNPFTE